MVNFKMLKDDEVSESNLAVFAEIEEMFGFVPVFYRVLANAPSLVEANWLTHKKVLIEGVLPTNIKELIFLAVARKRQCRYCSSIHLAVCVQSKISHDDWNAVLNDISTIKPARIARLIAFCLTYIDTPDDITLDEFSTLEKSGISKREVIEAMYTTGFANRSVFLAQSFGMEVDKEVIQYMSENNLSIEN